MGIKNGEATEAEETKEAVLNNKDVVKEPKVKEDYFPDATEEVLLNEKALKEPRAKEERVGDSVNAMPLGGMTSHAWNCLLHCGWPGHRQPVRLPPCG